MEADSPFYTAQEVADKFQVHLTTAIRWGRQEKLPAYRTPGGRWRYPRKEVDRLWLERQQGEGSQSRESSTSTPERFERTLET